MRSPRAVIKVSGEKCITEVTAQGGGDTVSSPVIYQSSIKLQWQPRGQG
jgi:hypothetical protein